MQVATALRKAILSGQLKAGQEIVLKDMAEQLGVSSTPVREALQMLNRDGLVELRPNKQAIVIGVSRQHVTDFYETLAILEASCSRYAAIRGGNFDVLEEILLGEEAAVNEGSLNKVDEWNEKFHGAIRDLCGNKRLQRIIDDIRQSTTSVLYVATVERAKVQLVEHKEIYNAIINHDGYEAERLTEKHILAKLQIVLAQNSLFDDEA